MTEPSLPQRSTDVRARTRSLENTRSQYTYQTAHENPMAPIAVAGKYPFKENYFLDWALPYLPRALTAIASTTVNKAYYKIRSLFGSFDILEAYKTLFNSRLDLPFPAVAADWQDDGAWARRWLDGPDPMTLRKITSAADLAARIDLSEADFQRALPGTRTLANEIADGNLYVVDYQLLEQSLIPASPVHRDSRWRPKYLPAPVLVLCERAGVDPKGDLIPVAITVDQRAATAPNPLYVRGAGKDWSLAKAYVDVADFNLQAMSSHIYRHHYTAEPFAVSSRRQLSEEHPLFVFLEPHIRYTIEVNHFAANLMKEPGSGFDTIYAGELPETRNIMLQSRLRWQVWERRVDLDLAARGVTTTPHDYPWREDALLWKAALDRYADTFLRTYYVSDADVAGDWELQNWFAELHNDQQGGLIGLTPSGHLQTVAELVDLIAEFLFTAGPSHAAVHFPQTDYLTYVPMIPGAAYLPPPEPGDTIDDARLLKMLPPYGVGADQFQTNQIAFYRFDTFGHFDKYRLSKLPVAQPAIARLKADLEDIEAQITTRNQSRRRPYIYMLPSLVPNSINV